MAVEFFQVELTVQPKAGGEAELVVPNVLQGLNYQFILVEDGGKKGILKLDASEAEIKKIEENKNCKKLAESQMKKLKQSYPVPKLKQKYRPQTQKASETATASSSFFVDEQGDLVVDTWQTVRSGFYLIDVPILPPLGDKHG